MLREPLARSRKTESSGRLLSVPVLSLIALLILLAAGIVAVVAFGLDEKLGLDAVRRHQVALAGFASGEPFWSSLLFMAVYAAAVAVSVPGVQVLAVLGGWLFGWFQGTIYVAVAATVAASAVFVLARTALAKPLRRRSGPLVKRFARGFRE
ncbi:MAG: TVP38/TMEM64 family protein, partial [Pseudomonadota bacterium]